MQKLTINTSLFYKCLLATPSLLGITLAVTTVPSFAAVNTVESPSPKTTTVSAIAVTIASSIPTSSTVQVDSDTKNERLQSSLQSEPIQLQEPSSLPANTVSLSTRASDLQDSNSPTPQIGDAPSQLSWQEAATSSVSLSVSTVRLKPVAANLTGSSILALSPGTVTDPLLLAEQPVVDCPQGGCTPPNPESIPPQPDTTSSPTEQSPTTIEPLPTSAATQPERWHFLLQPYIYLPFSIYGDATVKGYTADVSLGPDSIFSAIRNSLQFAFLGRAEAWTPNYRLGFILGGDYLAAGKDNTFTRPDPDRLADAVINRVADQVQNRLDDSQRRLITALIENSGLDNGQIQSQIETIVGQKLSEVVPTDFQSNVQVQNWSTDLAFAYRFYNASKVNPKGVATEFDLGPFLFDVIGGIRLGGTSGQLDVTSNLGGEGNFNNSVFNVSPLLGGRFRLNVSRKLALVIAGSVSGFGINTLWQYEALSGLDWKVWGNTSVGLGYRFAGINFNTGSGLDAFGVNLSNNGPYLSFTFRF